VSDNPLMGKTPLRWVDYGQLVYAKRSGEWVLCTVECTAGEMVHIVNTPHRISSWVAVRGLRAHLKEEVDVQ
jgi:hypothetical protein